MPDVILRLTDDRVQVVVQGSDLLAPLVAAAAASAQQGQGFALDAGAARDLAQARAAVAQQAATDSAAYLNATKALTGQGPISAALTIQAPSRAVLAAVNAPTAGAQAYLGEAGREGVFTWITGDQSAKVATDPDQALYVPPAGQPNGAGGVWRRILAAGYALATWAGVVTGGGVDQVPAINRLLAMPGVWAVQLPTGTITAKTSVRVPDNKGFVGAGKLATTLKAAPDWAFTGNDGDAFLATHFMVNAGSGSRVSDMTVDGVKTGAKSIVVEDDNNRRLNGVNGLNADNFVGERLHVANITGYGLLFTGCTNSRFSHCSTANIQVHCEATNASKWCLYDDISCRAGDGDIQCESPFHALNASQFITFRSSSFIGDAASGLLVRGNEPNGVPTTGIRAENLLVTLTGATVCITVGNDNPAVPCVVDVVGGSYSSQATAYGVTNATVRLSGKAKVKALTTGVGGANGRVDLGDSTLSIGEGLGAGSYADFWPFDAATRVIINGTRLVGKANGENSIQCPFKGAIQVIGQPDLTECPTKGDESEQLIIGKGHRVSRTIQADYAGAEFYVGREALGQALGFKTTAGCRYRVVVEGSATSLKGTGFVLAMWGASTAQVLYGGEAFIQPDPTNRNVSRTLVDTWEAYYVAGNRLIATSSDPAKRQQFRFEYLVDCPNGNGSIMRLMAAASGGDGFGQYAVNNFGAGNAKVFAGATMTVEQVD